MGVGWQASSSSSWEAVRTAVGGEGVCVAFCWEEDCGGGAAPLVTGEEMEVERGG